MAVEPRRSERLRNARYQRENVVDAFLTAVTQETRRSRRLQNLEPENSGVTASRRQPTAPKQSKKQPSRKQRLSKEPEPEKSEQDQASEARPKPRGRPKKAKPKKPTRPQEEPIDTATELDVSQPVENLQRLQKLKTLFENKRILKSDIKRYNLSESDLNYINTVEKSPETEIDKEQATESIPSATARNPILPTPKPEYVDEVDEFSDNNDWDVPEYSTGPRPSIYMPKIQRDLQAGIMPQSSTDNTYEQNRMQRAYIMYSGPIDPVLERRADNIIINTFTDMYEAKRHVVIMGTMASLYADRTHITRRTFTIPDKCSDCDLEFRRQSKDWVEYNYIDPTPHNSRQLWEPNSLFIYAHPDAIALDIDTCEKLQLPQEPIGCSCLDNYYRSPYTPDGQRFTGCKHMWYIRFLMLTQELTPATQ